MRRRHWMRQALTYGGGGFLALLALSVVLYQNNLFKYWTDPHAPFQTSEPPPVPDYRNASAWALRPDDAAAAGAAVFFVHPTTYWGGNAWNAAIDDAASSERLSRIALPNHAGPFARVGSVWAPRYRQATLLSFLTHRYDARRARAFAYEDVARAFEAFLGEAPAEAPIIIAGVEQGGLHVLGLLQHMAVSEPVRNRIAAVYVIEQATPLDLFDGALAHSRPCATPDMFRCVVSWGARSETDSDEVRRYLERSMVWSDAGRLDATINRSVLCVNPVLGATGEDFAPRRLHRGGVNATGIEAGVEPAPLAAQTSTLCRAGVLLVDRPESSSLRSSWSWGGRYKPDGFNLFYEDIRLDAERRLAAFEEVWADELTRAPPLEEAIIEIHDSPVQRVPD